MQGSKTFLLPENKMQVAGGSEKSEKIFRFFAFDI